MKKKLLIIVLMLVITIVTVNFDFVDSAKVNPPPYNNPNYLLLYVNDTLPFGENYHTTNDIGTLDTFFPTSSSYVYCGAFTNMVFNDTVHSFTGIVNINNIYLHLWCGNNTPSNSDKITVFGYRKYHTVGGSYAPSGEIYNINISKNQICKVKNFYEQSRYFSLISFFICPPSYNPVNLTYNPDENIFNNFSIVEMDGDGHPIFGGPNITCSPFLQSWIIINLPDNCTLMSLDSDNDGLDDYNELWVYHTNPKYYDSDVDSVSDYTEVMIDYSDPNDWFS